ncbi:MAG: hypothetical protein IJ542_02875 [Clostridia bacterium]|nr:hypothetical protein [Clostridia bacterium]
MLQLIKNVALILDDKQSFASLENSSDLQVATNANINTYLTLANFVIRDIAANFLCFYTSEKLLSNEQGKIMFSNLSHQPCRIKKVKNFFGKSVAYDLHIDSIVVPSTCEQYSIEYSYFPDDYNLTDALLLPMGLDSSTVCYGVVSEYYSLKMQFNEAAIWEAKYKNGLKNLAHKHYDRFLLFRGL